MKEANVTTGRRAFVDELGRFHCACGKTHERGPINGGQGGQCFYRCLGCGGLFSVTAVAELRRGAERSEA